MSAAIASPFFPIVIPIEVFYGLEDFSFPSTTFFHLESGEWIMPSIIYENE